MSLTYCLQCGVELEGDAERESGRCGLCDEQRRRVRERDRYEKAQG